MRPTNWIRLGDLIWLFSFVVLVFLLGTKVSGAEDDWKYDLVYLKKTNVPFRGLVVRETPDKIYFKKIFRDPGKAAKWWPMTFARDEVDSIESLEGKDREQLVARIKLIDPTGLAEKQRMKILALKPAPWGKDAKGKALRYESFYFTLDSNAREDIVRQTAVRLEQIFFAYTRYLPPRYDSADPTRIFLAQTLADYRDLLGDQGRNLLNPAFYDAAANKIVCAAELQRLGDDLERASKKNQDSLNELEDRQAELKRVYKNKIPRDVLANLEKKRDEVRKAQDANEKAFGTAFKEATRRLMQRLYHESFHAYLANFVYPPDKGEIPRWLNEGLAQIFEDAVLDADELRIGWADKDRLRHAQAVLKKGELIPLTDLLKSGPKHFLVAHATDKEDSNRYYLTSWGLAYYLTFERKLLGTKAVDNFVEALEKKTDQAEAFRTLVDQPLAEFEKEFRKYLENLKPDGTMDKREHKP